MEGCRATLWMTMWTPKGVTVGDDGRPGLDPWREESIASPDQHTSAAQPCPQDRDTMTTPQPARTCTRRLFASSPKVTPS